MASIEFKCYATLKKFQPDDGRLEITPGESLGTIADRLGMDRDHVHIRFINGNHSQWDATVADGDRVGFFPAVGGG